MKTHLKVTFFLLKYLIAEGTLLLIALVIFIFGGKHSINRASNILFFIGSLPLIINLFTVFRNWLARGNFNYQYDRSVSKVSVFKRFTEDQTSSLKSILSPFFLFLVGITTISLSFIIYLCFK